MERHNKRILSKLKSYWIIIPCHNEEESLPILIESLGFIEHPPERIIVVNNNSTDNTAEIAKTYGAIVLEESKMGYGIACQKAIQFIKEQDVIPDCVVFMDGDNSDDPKELNKLLKPLNDGFDISLGSRTLGNPELGSLTQIQRFGNSLSCWLLKLLYGVRFTDLGPFRAVRTKVLLDLNLTDKNYGWTIELQSKIAEEKIPWIEVPVNYRKRLYGISKVSGNSIAIIKAGWKILFTIIFWFIYYRTKSWKSSLLIHFFLIYIICFGISLFVSKHDVLPMMIGLTFSYFILFIKINLSKPNSKEIGFFYLFTGILIRIPFLFTVPLLSDDYFRTIWDASLILNSMNPYMQKPIDVIGSLDVLNFSNSVQMNNLYASMNSKDFYSFYPPIQHLIAVISILPDHLYSYLTRSSFSIGITVFTMKLILLSFDIGNLILLRKLLRFREENLRFYSWNPLVLLEGIGNLHFEIPVLFFLLLFFNLYRKNSNLSGVSLALGSGTKLIPVLLYPYILFNKFGKKIKVLFLLSPLILVIGLYTIVQWKGIENQWLSGIGLYSHSFEFFSFMNYYIRIFFSYFGFNFQGMGIWIWGFVFLTLLMLLFFSIERNISPEKFFFLSLSIVFLFSPILHPWYLITWIGLGILLGYRVVLLAGYISISSYSYYSVIPYERDSLIVSISYILFFCLLFKEFYEYKCNRDRISNISRSIRNFY